VYRVAFLIGLALVCAALVGVALLGGGDDTPGFGPLEIDNDPFAYESGREEEFRERATAGHSQVIYAKSPDGVMATARRVEAYRPKIEEVAAAAGVDPDLVEGMVLLESAGRPEVMATGNVKDAVGLTQILAETAVNLLGMRVDDGASRRRVSTLGPAARPAAPGGRALRSRQGARRDGPLSADRDG
jgi:hypothetical protein